jgi:hypothetical protein
MDLHSDGCSNSYLVSFDPSKGTVYPRGRKTLTSWQTVSPVGHILNILLQPSLGEPQPIFHTKSLWARTRLGTRRLEGKMAGQMAGHPPLTEIVLLLINL